MKLNSLFTIPAALLMMAGQTSFADVNDAVDSTRAAAKEIAQTAKEGKPSVGLRLGVAEGSGNFTEGFEYGAEVGTQVWDQVSIVAELSGTTVDRTGNKPSLTRTKLLGKGFYNFAGNIPVIKYSYVGAGLGPVYDNVVNEGKWNLGFSPQAGFDIPLSSEMQSKISLGLNVAMLYVTGGTPNTFSANAVAKYWF